jgi:hypothetical protein
MSSKDVMRYWNHKLDLIYKKLYERCMQLWRMYGLNLLKLSTFYGKLMDKSMLSHQFVIFWPNFDIIVIIFWPSLGTLVKQHENKFSSVPSKLFYMK